LTINDFRWSLIDIKDASAVLQHPDSAHRSKHVDLIALTRCHRPATGSTLRLSRRAGRRAAAIRVPSRNWSD